jgi:hypothetical protein
MEQNGEPRDYSILIQLTEAVTKSHTQKIQWRKDNFLNCAGKVGYTHAEE